MLIDCDTCTVRGLACGDCVVTVLLGAPPDGVELDATDQAAISALAEHGLVPPLRLVGAEGIQVKQSKQNGGFGQTTPGLRHDDAKVAN